MARPAQAPFAPRPVWRTLLKPQFNTGSPYRQEHLRAVCGPRHEERGLKSALKRFSQANTDTVREYSGVKKMLDGLQSWLRVMGPSLATAATAETGYKLTMSTPGVLSEDQVCTRVSAGVPDFVFGTCQAGGSQQQQWTERVTGRPVKPSCHCGLRFPTYEATASRGTLRACETAKRHLEKKEKTRQLANVRPCHC